MAGGSSVLFDRLDSSKYERTGYREQNSLSQPFEGYPSIEDNDSAATGRGRQLSNVID